MKKMTAQQTGEFIGRLIVPLLVFAFGIYVGRDLFKKLWKKLRKKE